MPAVQVRQGLRHFELDAEPGSYSITGAPAALIGPAVLAYAVVTHDGYHLASDHHDLIAYGTELALVVALIFVGGRLVAGRLLR
jgi:hypothetical protein